MGQDISKTIRKNLPFSMDRTWNLFATEQGLKQILHVGDKTMSRAGKKNDSISNLKLSVVSSNPLHSATISMMWPNLKPHSVTIRFVARPQKTAICIRLHDVQSEYMTALSRQFWNQRISLLA